MKSDKSKARANPKPASLSGRSDELRTRAEELARYLSESLDMDFVRIDRLVGDGLAAKPLVMYDNGTFQDNAKHTLKDTPCGEVAGKTSCCFPVSVRRLFPKDEVLQTMKAESYIGATLWSFDGKPIGLIAVIGRKPLANPGTAESVLKIVSLRAAGELQRALAEEALRSSTERYRSYIEVTGQLGWTTNAAGEVTEDLPAWRAYTGQTAREIAGWGWSEALHPEDLARAAAAWRSATADKMKYEIEYRIHRQDGVYRHFMARGVPVLQDDGSVREWVGTDATADRRPAGLLAHLHERGAAAVAESGAIVTHDPLPKVYADRTQLVQLFQNLVGNAIKFRGDGAPAIHVGAKRQQESWLLSVTDNGIGVDPAQHQRIFEIFQRLHSLAKYSGTGIGLAICKRS